MTGYSVEVLESSVALTSRDRIRIKDTSNTIALDKATQEEAVIIEPAMWAILSVHNEHSNDKEYVNYIVVDRNGDKYRTGSESFWSAFMEIWKELEDDDEPFEIKAYRLPSKNRSGKDFITCSLI